MILLSHVKNQYISQSEKSYMYISQSEQATCISANQNKPPVDLPNSSGVKQKWLEQREKEIENSRLILTMPITMLRV